MIAWQDAVLDHSLLYDASIIKVDKLSRRSHWSARVRTFQVKTVIAFYERVAVNAEVLTRLSTSSFSLFFLGSFISNFLEL